MNVAPLAVTSIYAAIYWVGAVLLHREFGEWEWVFVGAGVFMLLLGVLFSVVI